MTRILHVMEDNADFQTQRCVRQLCRMLGEGFSSEVRTIGRRGDWRSAFSAVAALRLLREFDVLHAWGGRALTAAAMGWRLPLLHSPSPAAGRSALGWLRAVMACREVQVVVPTPAMQRAMARGGVDPERCQIITPGVDFSKVRARRNPPLRAELGIGEDDYVLLAVGESTAAAAHEHAVWAAGILHVLDARYRLLIWGRGGRADAAGEFDRRIQAPGTLILAEQRLGRAVEFEELLPAADMILSSATGTTATLPLLIAMASGLPIVSTATYTTGDLLEDHRNALLAPKSSPRRVAQRILQLREDRALQWRLCETARAEAYERFSLTGMLEQYRGCYERCVGHEGHVQPRGAGV